MEKPMIDYEVARKLFRSSRGRLQRNFTMSTETDHRWRIFVESKSGTQIRPGNGLSSVMIELSMKLFMAATTGNPLKEVATCITTSMHPWAIEQVISNLKALIYLLEDQQNT